MCIILRETETILLKSFSVAYDSNEEPRVRKATGGLLCSLLPQDLHLVSFHCLGLLPPNPPTPLPNSLILILQVSTKSQRPSLTSPTVLSMPKIWTERIPGHESPSMSCRGREISSYTNGKSLQTLGRVT